MMKINLRNSFLIVFVSFFLSGMAQAQTDSISFNKSYIQKCFHDSKAIITSPIHWTSKDWTRFGIITTSLAATTLVDQPIANFSQKHRSKELDHFSTNFLEPFNDKYSLLLMGGFMAQGLFAKNKKSISTGLLLFEGYTMTMILVRIPKYLAGRKRPDAWPSSSPADWDGPFQGTSFPSGHTAAAFTVATVIANQYRDTPCVPVVAYSVASLVGMSRIYENRHWFSDVAAGAVIGTVIGNVVSRVSRESRLSFSPSVSTEFQGLTVSYVF